MGKIRKCNIPKLSSEIVAGLHELRSLHKDSRAESIAAALDWIAVVHRNELDRLGIENPEQFRFQIVETREDGSNIAKYGSDSSKDIAGRIKTFERLGCHVHVEQNGQCMVITKVGRAFVIGKDVADDL